jgi:hypothetical protein
VSTPEERVRQRAHLVSQLEDLLNGQSAENGSNTPDFILAEFLAGCLAQFNASVLSREDWYGHRHAPGQVHGYVSTACFHAECGDCRLTCKYCDTPCQHICHAKGITKVMPSWVDQARAIARELLFEHLRPRLAEPSIPPALLDRIEHDPDLFWLRGEEVPPGRRS